METATAPPPKKRSEAEILRSLLENGVAKRFDLVAWANAGCRQPTPIERLLHLFEQCRPDVAKLIVLEELEGTPEEDADVLVYGEIDTVEFTELLNKYGGVNALGGGGGDDGGRVFYDLGSGTGKAVCAAGLCAHFRHVRGVEILPCTAAIASVLVEDFVRDVLPGSRPAGNALVSVDVERGDLFAREHLERWRRADLVFCNCVTWDDDTMTTLSRHAEGLRPGAVFITVLCPLASDAFELVEEVELKFSWGSVEALVHRRLTDEQAAAAAALGAAMEAMEG